jgi:putative transposase
MSRPLRIEFPGATHHVTARGDRREPIFVDDVDRTQFLTVLSQGLTRFNARLLAYCLMGNHYHLVLLTPQANLSLLMRHVNGVYTQTFNRRHGVVGHLFQGRFKGILVDTDSYLMALCRYVELNPVRAKLVEEAAAWPWSSYLAHTGHAVPLQGLDVRTLHDFMLGRACIEVQDRRQAALAYAEAVAQGVGENLWPEGLRQQIYLGDADFVQRMQALAEGRRQSNREVPMAQRAQPLGLQDWLARSPTREAALVAAHRQSGLSMTEMAQALNLSVSRVSRLISREEERQRAAP